VVETIHLVADEAKYERLLANGIPFMYTMCGEAARRRELTTDPRLCLCPLCLDQAGIPYQTRRDLHGEAPDEVSVDVGDPYSEEGVEIDESVLDAIEGDTALPPPEAPPGTETEDTPEDDAMGSLSMVLESLVPEGVELNMSREELEAAIQDLPEEDKEFIGQLSQLASMAGAERASDYLLTVFKRLKDSRGDT